MKSFIKICLLFCIFFLPHQYQAGAQNGITPGIQLLYRLDQMPSFKQSIEVGSVSSYDRTGGNNDGFDGEFSFIRKEKDGLVIADLEGPGVIYRIWTPTPSDDWMEFYFDGEKEPRIRVRFRELFLGDYPGFEAPLVGFGAGGFYSYVPIPYRKSCKILVRADRFQFYQINYARYPDDIGVETYSTGPDPGRKQYLMEARKLFSLTGRDISRYTAPAGDQIKISEKELTLQAGQKALLFQTDQPGRIVGIRLKPSEGLKSKKRNIVLCASWDDDPEPAIFCPAGDFFGYAWGEPAMKSLLIGTNENGENYCYFPMPFDRSARIELIAEENLKEPVSFTAEILISPTGLSKNEGRFYTLWRRENPTTKGKPFSFLETEGRGHVVGVVQQSQGMESGNTYYFEGDDQTTIDGELVIHGTGSEDFYNGGWYDVPGRWESRVSFPLSGCLGYKKHLGRTGGYRILLGDAYAYRESILQTIEHAPTENELINDYVGVTYFYSNERPTCEIGLLPIEARRVKDPERIVFAAWWNVPIYSSSINNAMIEKKSSGVKDENGRDIRVLSFRGVDQDYFGPHSISFLCELPADGLYKVSLDVVEGPDQGKIQLFRHEAAAGPAADLYNGKKEVATGILVGQLEFNEGPNQIMFKIIGKNENSHGLGFDLTNIVFERTGESR
jgi:hypothetical protein